MYFILNKKMQSLYKSQNWTFRQHRFSCHHQQCMQGTTKPCKIGTKLPQSFVTALHTLLMMTAEFMLSKRPVLRFIVALLFLLTLFSSHIYCKLFSSFFFMFCSLISPEWCLNSLLLFSQYNIHLNSFNYRI